MEENQRLEGVNDICRREVSVSSSLYRRWSYYAESMMKAIRGAIFVKDDSPLEIKNATLSLMNELFSSNELKDEEVISVIFSLTNDLRSANPAAFFRKAGHDVPLMCLQEADFKHSPKRVLRVLVFVERLSSSKIVNVYKGESEKLKDWKWFE